MERRQTTPSTWLIADERLGDELWSTVRRLRPGSGILLLYNGLPKAERARLLVRLRRLGRSRKLVIADELAGEAARVHDSRELRRALQRRTPLILLSAMFATRSHPEWQPLPRMRAATLARLASAPVVALGGMDSRRFAMVKALGFHGWAGIDAFVRI